MGAVFSGTHNDEDEDLGMILENQALHEAMIALLPFVLFVAVVVFGSNAMFFHFGRLYERETQRENKKARPSDEPSL